jgi:hypothetical protein
MLAAALKFNDDDLQANRAGRLTVRQRNRVYVQRRMVIITLTLITAFIGVISAIVILAVLLGAVKSEVAILLALGGEVITAGLAYLVWSLRQNYKTYLGEGYVAHIKGPVTMYQLRERQDDKTKTVYALRVGHLEFEIPEPALSAFTEGSHYMIYYTPEPLTLLSAEPAE